MTGDSSFGLINRDMGHIQQVLFQKVVRRGINNLADFLFIYFLHGRDLFSPWKRWPEISGPITTRRHPPLGDIRLSSANIGRHQLPLPPKRQYGSTSHGDAEVE